MRLRTRYIPLLWLAVAAQVVGVRAAGAGVLAPTPSLPLLGEAYASADATDCFPAAGACIAGGELTLTALVSDTFSPSGQDIVTGAVFSGELTTPGGTPIGPLSLLGTVEQAVVGRTTATATGSWTADLTALTLSGPALGHTLTISLDASSTSSGTTSIVPSGGEFLIDSFFDVFVDLSLDGTAPLSAERGPIAFDAVPEPISLLVLAPAGLALLAARRRAIRPRD